MNRSVYFNFIEEKLISLSVRIKLRGTLNLLELNIHSEGFFAELLNLIFDYSLENINRFEPNADGIDLIDKKNKLVMQVSSTGTKQKIEHSLTRDKMKEYAGFHFIFVLITGDGGILRGKEYTNPYKLNYDSSKDIYDIQFILDCILSLNVVQQKKIYDFIRDELELQSSIPKIDTNLAMIIESLRSENLSEEVTAPNIQTFEILKKIDFNGLTSISSIISEYQVYYSKLSEKYKEYDVLGINTSRSILCLLHKIYEQNRTSSASAPELFFSIIDEACKFVQNSRNYVEMPLEELEMCVSIVVVDAFIRCKIFENPEGYRYAVT